VSDAAGKLAERIELQRLGELLVHRLEIELRIATLGDVACDLCEADQFAVLIDRIDHHACPEEGTVLADAPAFFLITALFPRHTERAGRLTVCTVGFGVEPGKVLAEDLFGQIALDALSADV